MPASRAKTAARIGAPLGTGQFLSESWKDPGDEYPVTPGLLPDVPRAFIPGGEPVDKQDQEAKLQYEMYQLQQPDGPPVSKSHHDFALRAAREFHMDTVKSNLMGFQCNMENSYSHLSYYLDTHMNNAGDPFITGNTMSQTKFMERAVLDYFAALWKADWPHDCYREKAAKNGVLAVPQKPSSYWGFVLSMGSTEGTLYGLWNGRDYLSGKVMLLDTDFSPNLIAGRHIPRLLVDPLNVNRLTPICFFSADSHYCLQKAMVILNIKTFHSEATERDEKGNLKYPICPLKGYDTWPEKVPSNKDGTMNVDALVTLVEFFASKGYPPLISFNFGTTFKGSYDNVEEASRRLLPILDKHGLLERDLEVAVGPGMVHKISRQGYWFHVDGALGAAYIPFLRMAQAEQFSLFPKEHKVPEFDFSLRGPKPEEGGRDYSGVEVVQSIAMSGHKWMGAPVPTGVYMTKSKFQLMPPEIFSVVGTPDTTFAGSRSGLSSVFLWDYLARHSFNQLMEKAVCNQNMAAYLFARLKELENLIVERKCHSTLIEKSLWIQRVDLSLSVIFRRPIREIVIKYSLPEATENQRSLVHGYAMEHVTRDMIDSLFMDLQKNGAFENPPTFKQENFGRHPKEQNGFKHEGA